MRWKHTILIAVIMGMSLCLLVLALSLNQASPHMPNFKVQRVAAIDPDNEQRVRAIAKRPLKGSPVIPVGFVPIDVDVSYSLDTSTVTLCKLDFATYAQHPSSTPMFRDLVKASQCSGDNTMHATLADLEVQDTGLEPTGFIFHESRCGSTLVANILASDPENIVYSESHPPAAIALHCEFCTPEYRARALRAVIKGMGNVDKSRYKRLFFKFQSINSASTGNYLNVFLSVPWMFIYRDPVEVLASYFQKKASEAPLCSRTRSSPPHEIAALVRDVRSASPEQYCAAYLNMLCSAVLREVKASSNGIVINYNTIPTKLLDIVFPKHFNYPITEKQRARMLEEAGTYSKSRGEDVEFKSDSEKKHDEASRELHRWADEYVGQLFKELEVLSQIHIAQLQQKQVDKADSGPRGNAKVNYSYVDAPNKDADIGRWIVGGKVDRFAEAMIAQHLHYPKLRPLREFLDEWNPDDPDVPAIPGIAEGTLARFNYSDPEQRIIAEVYRLHEVPFMLTDVPNAVDVTRKWNNDEYLKKRFGNLDRKVTYSTSNHFMYYNKRSVKEYDDKDYKPPTSMVDMPFPSWLEKAYAAEHASKDDPHFYLQLNADGLDKWIQEDLTIFEPKHSFFTVEAEFNRGINCRFGTRGIIAEAHYDGGRNFIAMLRGAKRYILLPPSECKLMELYPRGHPEARHSAVDWSNVDWASVNNTMAKAQATQVVLRAGEIMYLPSYWFHYIVSTGISIQCNSRSGNAIRGRNVMVDCGFY